MIDIQLVSVHGTGDEVIVKANTFEDEDDARNLYDRLTEQYADQSLPFFEDGESLIRLEIVPTETSNTISECYFEYSDELKGDIYNRL